jgi:hypothetical protein
MVGSKYSRRIVGPLVGMAALAVAAAPTAMAGDMSASYVSVPGDAGTFGVGAAGQNVNAGGAGFTVGAGDHISITIKDDTGRTVNGKVKFTDAQLNGKQVGAIQDICGGKLSDVVVPDGAVEAFVFVPTLGVSNAPTILCGSPNGATHGTITLSGSSAGAASSAHNAPAQPARAGKVATTRSFSSQKVASGARLARGMRLL